MTNKSVGGRQVSDSQKSWDCSREEPLWSRVSCSYGSDQFDTMGTPDGNFTAQSGRCERGEKQILNGTSRSLI